ncbi:MAG: hypothetical protein PHC60_05270 [Heliobacteriaceae bacterium]|nr:hypothetical protein [Heliobacteriaceae bacterium]
MRWIPRLFLVITLLVAWWEPSVAGANTRQPGDLVPAEVFAGAGSLSAGTVLTVDREKNLFFSNLPEMPTEPGILARVDNVVSPGGIVRVLYCHFNLLIDYQAEPYRNISANIGVVFVNNTNRTLDVCYTRLANGVNRNVTGRVIHPDDLAPPQPGGDREPVYFGSQLGNAVLAGFFAGNPGGREQLWATIAPGGKTWFYDAVGPRSWAIGMGDFLFRDHATGELITTAVLAPDEQIGIRSFISRDDADLAAFYGATDCFSGVLGRDNHDPYHMRGLFTGVTRSRTFDYDSRIDGCRTITVAVPLKAQATDPERPYYAPDMFVNDFFREGIDPCGRLENGCPVAMPAGNNGSYGADWEFVLHLKGPVAIAVQGAVPLPGVLIKPFPDMYNQFLTVMLDEAPENLRTLRIADPAYREYYADFSQLGPLGAGRVAYVLPGEGEKTHVLKLALPPNGYGPFKIMLMPALPATGDVR